MVKKQQKKKKTTKTTSRPRKTPQRANKAVKRTVKKKAVRRKSPKNTDIVISSPVAPNVEIMIASELADDQLIEREMTGDIMPFFIYQFQNRGKNITGLTVKGVNEVVRRLNRDKRSGVKIRINPVHIRVVRDVDYDGEKGIEVSVYAENLVDGNSAWGIKFEPYKKWTTGKTVNGKWIEPKLYKNDFVVEKALSKAERNAKRKLIPEVLAIKTIEAIVKTTPKSVKQILPPPPQHYKVKKIPPKQSSQSELEQIVINLVNNAKTVDDLIAIAEQLTKSSKHNPKFKQKMSDIIKTKVEKM